MTTLETNVRDWRADFTILGRLEGLSHEEIAAKMGITPQSSKTYMVRALAALNKEMTGHAEKIALVFLVALFY